MIQFDLLQNFKGLLLDLDDTIYAYQPCHKAGYEACKVLAEKKYNIAADDFEMAWKNGRSQVRKDLSGQGASH